MPKIDLCIYCGQSVEEEVRPSDTCERCWYDMRLEPEAWEAWLKTLGRSAIYQGGCIPFTTKTGGGFMCRSPYRPGLRIVKDEK